jgi:curved DNA-binding protein CbpA
MHTPQVIKAYKVLSDKKLRAKYDSLRAQYSARGQSTQTRASPGTQQTSNTQSTTNAQRTKSTTNAQRTQSTQSAQGRRDPQSQPDTDDSLQSIFDDFWQQLNTGGLEAVLSDFVEMLEQQVFVS